MDQTRRRNHHKRRVYKKLINEYPELALDIEENLEKWIELLLPIENNIKLLSLLKEKGYSLYIISNFHLDAYNRFLKKQDWFTLFDGAIISAKEKLIKPDLRIYELLLERYQLKADECLFIDDSLNNINACKNVGMDGIHLPDNSKLEEELKKSYHLKKKRACARFFSLHITKTFVFSVY